MGLAGVADGAPGRPLELAASEGPYRWSHEASFALNWRNPGGTAAVGYRVVDPHGLAVVSGRFGWPAEGVTVRVPDQPAEYIAEVWAEDGGGARGPSATAALRHDRVRPGRLADPLPPTWIGRPALPLRLAFGAPAEPLSASGLAGVALALGAAPPGHPCPTEPCERARLLPGAGPQGTTVTLASLPEGRHHLAAVAVSGAGLPAREPARAVLAVDTTPPVTTLEGAPPGWSASPARLRARASDGAAGMKELPGLPRPFTAIRIGAGVPIRAAGAAVETILIEEGVHTVAHYARDAAGNVADGARHNGVANPAPAVTLVRIDRTPPRLTLAAPDPRDPELIRARVADALSGPGGEGWIGARRAGSSGRFEKLRPVPAPAGELAARWDSDSVPAGRYEFRAFARDRAGNAGSGSQRASGAALTLTAPLKAGTRLQAGLRVGAQSTVRFGRGAVFAGRLANSGGTALPGRVIRIVERFAPGAAFAARTTPVTTNARGRFKLRLAPGPSREVEAEFGGGPTQTRAASTPARLNVRASVRLRASAPLARIGGRPVVFSGRVAAERGEIPPGGKSVQLQFRLPGLEWSEFRTVQTDRRGRFRYAYRFADNDSRGVRFLFRAHAPAQAGWPYEPGSSWPLAVSGG